MPAPRKKKPSQATLERKLRGVQSEYRVLRSAFFQWKELFESENAALKRKNRELTNLLWLWMEAEADRTMARIRAMEGNRITPRQSFVHDVERPSTYHCAGRPAMGKSSA